MKYYLKVGPIEFADTRKLLLLLLAFPLLYWLSVYAFRVKQIELKNEPLPKRSPKQAVSKVNTFEEIM